MTLNKYHLDTYCFIRPSRGERGRARRSVYKFLGCWFKIVIVKVFAVKMTSFITRLLLRRSRTVFSKHRVTLRGRPALCQQLSSTSSSHPTDGTEKSGNANKKDGEVVPSPEKGSEEDEMELHDSDKYSMMKSNRIPSRYDKKLLVWGGIYEKESDIPRFITDLNVTTAKDRLRVVLMMCLTLTATIACLTTIRIGQKERNAKIRDRLNVDRERFNQVFNTSSK